MEIAQFFSRQIICYDSSTKINDPFYRILFACWFQSKLRRKQSNRSVTPLYKLYHQTKLVQCGTLASVHPIHFTSFPRNSHKINSCAYLVFSNRFLTTRYHTTMKQKIQNIFMKIRHFFISVKNEANFSLYTVLLI